MSYNRLIFEGGERAMAEKQVYPMISEKSWWQIRNQFKKTIPSVVKIFVELKFRPVCSQYYNSAQTDGNNRYRRKTAAESNRLA
jgi:hypothetical protein